MSILGFFSLSVEWLRTSCPDLRIKGYNLLEIELQTTFIAMLYRNSELD